MNTDKAIPELGGDSHSITGLGSAPGVTVNSCTAEQPFSRHGASHTALRFTVNYICTQLSRKKKKKKNTTTPRLPSRNIRTIIISSREIIRLT